jgi:hypothetical protein
MASFWTKPRRVFFTWGVVELVGWITTYYWPASGVNWVWLGLAIIGLIPMFMYMSFKSPKLRRILILWIVIVAGGMLASFAAFYVPAVYRLASYLGAFWLIIMGIGFVINALWWTPRLFLIGGVLQLAAGVAVALAPGMVLYQYLVAAVVGSGAMFLLMIKPAAR